MPSRVRSTRRFADRVVVHLPVDVFAGGNPFADIGAVRIDAPSRHPREQLVGARQRGVVGAPGCAGAAIGRCLAVGHHQTALDDRRPLRKVDHEHAGVMHDRAIARTKLERLGEAILAPRHLGVEHLHAEFAFGRNREVDRHLEDRIRLASKRPAFGKRRQRRQVGVAAPGRAALHPRHDGVDLRLRQAAVVAHLQRVCGIGSPRRHLTRDHLVLDHLGPRPHVLVRRERHRGDLATAVTRRAIVEDDRSHVLRERGHGGGGGMSAGHDRERTGEQTGNAFHQASRPRVERGRFRPASAIPNRAPALSRRIVAHLAAATHDGDTSVTEVTLSRLRGAALMNRPLTITV